MLYALFQVIVGILLLYLGAETLVRGGKAIGLHFGLSPLVVGLTIVSLSTSMPEAVVSFIAQVQGGSSDLALGNVIGSNIANIGLILGLVALIFPQATKSVKRRQLLFFLLATLALFVVMSKLYIGPLVGTCFLIALITYLYVEVKMSRTESENTEKLISKELGKNLFFVLFGGAVLVYGGEALVGGSVFIAKGFGMSDAVIGLTIVSIGTSLPELAASMVAAKRHEPDIAIGNVIGSNIFNILFIVGGVSCISPLQFSVNLFSQDALVMLLFTIPVFLLAWKGKLIPRWGGACFLVAFIGYLTFLLS